jgi:hypothetical protein
VDIFQQVKALGLPLGQYVVFGSGPLAARSIRATSDVDLFTTTALYDQLRADGWQEVEKPVEAGGLYLAHGIYEADDKWRYGAYDPRPEDIIEAADTIDGVPFAPLLEVLKWKRAFGRPKDAADVQLIERFMRVRRD